MKYLLVFNTHEPESVWNGLRFGSAALGRAHEVNISLLGAVVEIENIEDERSDVAKQLAHFQELGGPALRRGTCLRSRHPDPAACPISTMDDLVRLSAEADKVLNFG